MRYPVQIQVFFFKFVQKENDKPLDFSINPIDPFIDDLRYFSLPVN